MGLYEVYIGLLYPPGTILDLGFRVYGFGRVEFFELGFGVFVFLSVALENQFQQVSLPGMYSPAHGLKGFWGLRFKVGTGLVNTRGFPLRISVYKGKGKANSNHLAVLGEGFATRQNFLPPYLLMKIPPGTVSLGGWGGSQFETYNLE